MPQVNGFTVDVPKKEPIRHLRSFSKDEVIAALSLYLRHYGVKVPEGDTRIGGSNRNGDDCRVDNINLIIYVEAD